MGNELKIFKQSQTVKNFTDWRGIQRKTMEKFVQTRHFKNRQFYETYLDRLAFWILDLPLLCKIPLLAQVKIKRSNSSFGPRGTRGSGFRGNRYKWHNGKKKMWF